MKLSYLEAGEIVTTHGVRGEVKVLPWADGPDFLLEFSRVFIDMVEYKIESCRIQKSCNLLKLSGIDTMETAQLLRGKVICVSRSEAPEGMIFAAELEGVEVIADGCCIGVVSEVLDYPGNKVYVVKGQHTYMIPAVNQFVDKIDIENNQMIVHLIEGMRTDEN